MRISADVRVAGDDRFGRRQPAEHHVGQLGVRAPADIAVAVGPEADDHAGIVDLLQVAALDREQSRSAAAPRPAAGRRGWRLASWSRIRLI